VHYAAATSCHPLFAGIPSGTDFYFVHSYYCHLSESSDIAAETTYGISFPSALIRQNTMAVQFHPEKSGQWGLQLLHNFVSLCN
jgi:glutamine amidotransferase